MNSVYISLGSNIGEREANLQKSIELLNKMAGEVVLASSLYETEPWEMDGAKSFINQVVLLKTNLSADELLDILLEAERSLGRVRTTGKYESRVIDLDILFFNESIITSDKLTVPHPFLHQRKFVLEPLSEINPGFVHPVLNMTIDSLLLECGDSYKVAKITSKYPATPHNDL
jgi:2-amino-4-hydroxy-6-hydroxymethyldihydropteridine diphosphokinase